MNKEIKFKKFFVSLVLASMFSLLHFNTFAQSDLTVLELKKTVESDIEAGASNSYQIKLDRAQYLYVVVKLQGIDLDVKLYGTEGETLYDAGNLSGGPRVKTVFLVSETAGDYRLEIIGRKDGKPNGKYRVTIEEIRPANEKDHYLASAEKTFAEGELLQSQRKKEALQQAITKFKEAVSLFRSAENPSRESSALTNLGMAYYSLGQTQDSLDSFQEVLRISRETGERAVEAKILNNVGNIYERMGDTDKAIESFKKSLEIVKEINIPEGEGAILNNLASIYKRRGELEKSLEYAQSSLDIHKETGNKSGEANSLNSVGSILSDMEKPQEALAYYEEALGILQTINNIRQQAVVYNNIGTIYSKLGNKQRALDTYLKVLKLVRESGHKVGEAHTLSNIGSIYLALNEKEKALEYLQNSLPLRRETKDSLGEAITLTDLATTHNELGQWQKALDMYLQALDITQKMEARHQEAIILHRMGMLFVSRNESEKSPGYLNKALSIWEETGETFLRSGTLYELAKLEYKQRNFDEAEKYINNAFQLVENYRTKVGSQELRTSYFSSSQPIYKFYIDLLMQRHKQEPAKGFDAKALIISEKARARSMIDSLAESRVKIREGIDPELLKREQEVQKQINKKEAQRIKFANRKGGAEKVQAIAKEIDALLIQYKDIKTKIRINSPRYAELTESKSLDLKDIQGLLDPETMLLEYSLGEEQSYVWAVTSDSIKSYELPKDKDIEKAAGEVYSLLIARNIAQKGETPERQQIRFDKAEKDFQKASQKLSEMIISPLSKQLGKKRLVIVAEGALQYVPFAALPLPTRKDFQPLIVNNEVVTLPSASTLAVLRQKPLERKINDRSIAVIADPVFSESDSRVADSIARLNNNPRTEPVKLYIKPSDSALGELKRSANDMNIEGFRRLRFSRREADQIASLVQQNKSLKAVDFSADRDLVMSKDFSQYQIVHFATHGLLNNRNPELSGIVLSLVDERGQPIDGFLRLNEIYNLKLGADLVVLSACQTALGKEIKGEGLIGLTRGFMYAGAESVVASLWQVEDRATAELMKKFYRAMLKENQKPAQALRTAQIEMWREGRWSNPYYWAAFTLQGEWK
jgi:CHAT domain-containing protein/Flp pilus assembly protein TadD